MNYDQAARESFKKNKATAFSWYLASSYSYYLRYTSLLSDEVYDKMCLYLLENYDKLEHPHKHLVTKEMLQAGTGYNLKEEDYPLIVRITAEGFIREVNSGRSG